MCREGCTCMSALELAGGGPAQRPRWLISSAAPQAVPLGCAACLWQSLTEAVAAPPVEAACAAACRWNQGRGGTARSLIIWQGAVVFSTRASPKAYKQPTDHSQACDAAPSRGRECPACASAWPCPAAAAMAVAWAIA